MTDMGRLLIMLGIALVVIGVLITLAGRIPGLGNLPGDLTIARGNFRLYAPFGTMILVSIVLSVILNIAARLFR